MKKDILYKLFSHIPTLETERLILRGMRVSDAEDMYDYAKRPSVTQYLTWNPHTDPAETREYLTYVGQRYRTGDFYDWAVVDKETGRMIGTCGFTSFDLENDGAELGYVISPDHWGEGYATEALSKVMSFGFSVLGLNRMYVRILSGNEASERVARKCGMRHEATLYSSLLVKGEFRTVKIFAILRDEFFS